MPPEAGRAQSEAAISCRLLVIDDDPIQQKIISRIAGQAGFAVTVAGTFEEAARLIMQESFDCATLDLGLGSQDGALLLNTMADAGRHMPVIVTSGADEEALRTAVGIGDSLGFEVSFLSKPLKLPQLREALVRRRAGAAASEM